MEINHKTGSSRTTEQSSSFHWQLLLQPSWGGPWVQAQAAADRGGGAAREGGGWARLLAENQKQMNQNRQTNKKKVHQTQTGLSEGGYR